MKTLHFLLASLFLLTLLNSSGSYAELYKWIDSDGNVHYGDSPPENARLKKITGNVTRFTPSKVVKIELDSGISSKQLQLNNVVIYSTSDCDPCRRAVNHFVKNKISYSEYDIEKSARGAEDYKKLNSRDLPVILIGSQRLNGFNVQVFDRLYYGKS